VKDKTLSDVKDNSTTIPAPVKTKGKCPIPHQHLTNPNVWLIAVGITAVVIAWRYYRK